MTTPPTDPAQIESDEQALAWMSRQLEQHSQAMARHLQNHEENAALAEGTATVIADTIRAGLEAQHQSALTTVNDQLTSTHRRELHDNLTRIADRFNRSLQELLKQNSATMQQHLDTLRTTDEQRGREQTDQLEQIRQQAQQVEQQAQQHQLELNEAHAAALARASQSMQEERQQLQAQFQQLGADTVAELKELLNNTMEQNTRETEGKLADSRAVNAQQKADTDILLADSNRRWRRTTIILAALAAGAALLAVAALAVGLT